MEETTKLTHGKCQELGELERKNIQKVKCEEK